MLHDNQKEQPFLEALVGYAESGVVPYHTPGHKQGRGGEERLHEVLGDALRLDVSDVVHSQKYNHSWTEALQAAQDLAAQAFGAQATRFIANGTSGAIHVMLLTARMLGYERVVLPRESHISVFSALVLAGLDPIYVPSERLDGWNLLLPPDLTAELNGAGKETMAFTTYPTYYGITQPLQSMSEMTSLLCVDEAHGAHFAFHPALPRPALTCGAHVVAQSTHKVLGAFTQASMLHIGQSGVPLDLIDRALMFTQSTSPSGLLYASLDATREHMVRDGKALWGKIIEQVQDVKQVLNDEYGLTILQQEHLPKGYHLDATRLTIRTSDRGMHGVDTARILRQLGVQVEMADPWHVVLIMTWADDSETIQHLMGALKLLMQREVQPALQDTEWMWTLPNPKMKMKPREAALQRTRPIPLHEAKGKISAEAICPYPPGIPVVCPGEEISTEMITYLEHMRSIAFEVRGAADSTLSYITIIDGS